MESMKEKYDFCKACDEADGCSVHDKVVERSNDVWGACLESILEDGYSDGIATAQRSLAIELTRVKSDRSCYAPKKGELEVNHG